MFYFEANLMESQENKGLLRHVKVVDGTGAAIGTVNQGAIVAVNGLAKNTPYGADFKNYSVLEVTAPKAVTDRILIVDADEVNTTKVGGNIYKFIPTNYGITADGNKPLRARVPKIDDILTFSDENFESTPTVGKFAVTTANKFTLTPTADLAVALPDGGFAVVIEDSYIATTGAEASFTKFVCRVVQL